MDEYFRNRVEVDDPDLLQDRRKNDARLKSRFEHIFAKYERDFTGIGDEIDLESGEILVDNGHLTNMRHEVDPGKNTSSGLVRAFAAGEELEIESTENTEEDGEEDDDIVITGGTRRTGAEEEEDETSSAEYSSSGVITDGEDGEEDANPKPSTFEPDELLSDFYPENADLAATKKRKRSGSATRLLEARSLEISNEAGNAESSETTSRDTSPGDMLGNVPFLAESMQAIQTSRDNGPMDEAAIKALGQSIANQLAQYMTQAPRRKTHRPERRAVARESPWDFPALPRDQRRRTPTPPREPMSSSAALFTMSPGDGGSIWAPAQHPKQRKAKKPRTRLMQETVLDTTTDNDGDIDPLQSDSPRPSPRNPPGNSVLPEGGNVEAGAPRECNNCGETDTPNFRRGPDGEDLCNACGMYFYRYGLLKPPYDPKPAPSPPRPEPRHGTFSVLIPNNHGILPGDEYDIPVTPEASAVVGYPANTARRVVANGIRMTRFTVEEDEKVIKLREIDDYPWETIGRIVSGRSAYAVQCRYSKCLRGKNVEARRRLLEHGVLVKQPEEESEEKDFLVIDYDEEPRDNTVDGVPAASHDPYFNDRTPLPDGNLTSARMAQRSMRTSYQDLHDGQCRVFKRFTEEENATIVRLRETENMAWEQIHQLLPGRTLLSIQKHYRRELYEPPDDLDPAMFARDSKPLKFTKEEDDLIVKMRDEEKMSFAEMTDYLSERTKEALEARYGYVVARNAAAKRAAPRPGPRIKQEEEPPIRRLAPFYPDSTPYQQWIPGSTATPPPGHPYANSIHNTFGRIDPSAPTGYASAPSGFPPQTPAAPIPASEYPPRPVSVGPSAWAATQPASKGPLPFQPARKRPVSILPAPRWPVPADPFEYRPISKKKVLGPERDATPGPRRVPRVRDAGNHAGLMTAPVAPMVPTATALAAAVLPSQAAHSVLFFPQARSPTDVEMVDANSGHSVMPPSGPNMEAYSRQVTPTMAAASGVHLTTFRQKSVQTSSKINTPAREVIEISSDPPRALEDAQAPTPLPKSTNAPRRMTPGVLDFSNEEDRLIKKWREKEGACWSEITERLPHRTQQAVIDRYYDKIVGSSASVKAAVAQNARDPNAKHGKRYTDGESEKVLNMRDMGLSWQEMADQLPGRTSASVQSHFYGALLSSTKLKKHYEAKTPNKGPLAPTPLLRQALSNSVRRGEHDHQPRHSGAYAEYSLPPPGASGTLEDDIWTRPASIPSERHAMPQTPQATESDCSQAAEAGGRVTIHDSGVVMFDKQPVTERQTPPTWSSPYPHGHPPPRPQQEPPSATQSRSQSLLQHDTPSRVVADSQSPDDLLQPLSDPSETASTTPVLDEEDHVDEARVMHLRSSPPPTNFREASIESPIQSTRYGTPPMESTPYFHAVTPDANVPSVYETPARFNAQTMPYFLDPALEEATPSIEQFNSEPPVAQWTGQDAVPAEVGHSPPPHLQEAATAEPEVEQPPKRKPGRPRKKAAAASDPAPTKQSTRKAAVSKEPPGQPRQLPKRFASPWTRTVEAQDKIPLPQVPEPARSIRRRKLAKEVQSAPTVLNPALIDLISSALRSRVDMCMYRPEILAWITEHHGDFHVEGKWDKVLHFHLTASDGFTNLYPGRYQPLWTLTDEVDGVGFAGRRSDRRPEVAARSVGAGSDGLAGQSQLSTTASVDASAGAKNDVVNLVNAEVAEPRGKKRHSDDSQAFGSDDNHSIGVARPTTGTVTSSRKRRSTNIPPKQANRATKKARYSDPMPPPQPRRVKRERLSTPDFGSRMTDRSASVALPLGRRMLFARSSEDAEGDEDELA